MAFREVTLTEEERKALGGKFWKPKAIGDKLLGFFEKYTQRTHDFNDGQGPKTLHSYTFRNREGEWVHDANQDLHVKLQKAMRDPAAGGLGLQPGRGHIVAATYTHDVDTGRASKMKGFKVEVDTDFKRGSPPPPPPPKPALEDDIPF